MKQEYPDYILRMLRQRDGLDEDNTSKDNVYCHYPPNVVFSEVLEWEGIIGYTETIKGWILDIYGVDLDCFRVKQ